MNNNYTRLPKDLAAHSEKLRRIKDKPKSQKNAISHEQRLKSKSGKCNRIQRGIKDSLIRTTHNSKRGLVYIPNQSTNTQHYPPAYLTSHTEVIKFFPETVIAGIDENDNDIILPFQLPAWRYLSEKIKPYFYQLAMSEYELKENSEYRLVPFVFNESTALTTTINNQKLRRVDLLGIDFKKPSNRL